MDRPLETFPLLYRPSKYHPDTEDLTTDVEAREYWLKCFEEGLHMVSPCRNELTICNIIYYTFGITEFACYYS